MWVGWLIAFAAAVCMLTAVILAAASGYYMGERPYPNPSEKKHAAGWLIASALFGMAALTLSAISGVNLYNG